MIAASRRTKRLNAAVKSVQDGGRGFRENWPRHNMACESPCACDEYEDFSINELDNAWITVGESNYCATQPSPTDVFKG